MRRPVAALAVLFAFAVWISLLLAPPVYTVNEKADGRYVTLTGTVDSKEYALNSQEDDTYMKLTLSGISNVTGIPEEAEFPVDKDDKILCRITDHIEDQEIWAREGAGVRIRGKISLFRHPSNDGEFDECLYYNSIKGYLFALDDAYIVAYTDSSKPVRSTLSRIRIYLSGIIDELYEGRHGEEGRRCASALKAMLLGQSGMTDHELKDRFQASGIIHVICVSGLHISMAGMAVFRFLKKLGLPVPLSSGISFVLLLLYGMMTGMQTSCFRALVMFAFQMAARALGRTCDMITSLSAAAVLLLIEQPCYLYHSGFLFSFAAVAAIGLAAPMVPKPVRPLVVPLFTLPVQLRFYYAFPLYSIILNLIVIMFVPAVMAGGAVSVVLYTAADQLFRGFSLFFSILMYAAYAAADIPLVILRIFELLCGISERLPFYRIISGRPGNAMVLTYYVILIAVFAARNRKDDNGLRRAVIRTAVTAAAVFMLFRFRYIPPLSVYMLDVGQGDGLCIQTRDKGRTFTVLVDGGSSSRKNIGKYVEIPFLQYHGISSVDYCILTHDDLDHCSGILELMERTSDPDGIRIDHLALPSVSESCKGDTYKKIEKTAKEAGIPITYIYRGMRLKTGNAEIKCLHPAPGAVYPDANEYSAVLLLSLDRFNALLTGDLEGEGESDFLKYIGKSHMETNILKIAHHGSKGGTSEKFLDRISSHTALISCGRNNSYGHPAAETVERILNAGMRIYDTRSDGQICVTTDGSGKYSVHTFIDKSD